MGGQTTNKNPQDRKIKLSKIEFDEEKLRNLLSVTENRKPKKRCYYDDVYFDDDVESGDEFSENDNKSSDEECDDVTNSKLDDVLPVKGLTD